MADERCVGARIVVVNMPARWKILLDPEWINDRCICDWQKMAPWESGVNGRSTY